jgi:hypothetical protein
MNAIEEIKKSLYESYKWLYEEAVEQIRQDVKRAKERREWGKPGWAAEWLTSANTMYKLAIGYKHSMRTYAS